MRKNNGSKENTIIPEAVKNPFYLPYRLFISMIPTILIIIPTILIRLISSLKNNIPIVLMQ